MTPMQLLEKQLNEAIEDMVNKGSHENIVCLTVSPETGNLIQPKVYYWFDLIYVGIIGGDTTTFSRFRKAKSVLNLPSLYAKHGSEIWITTLKYKGTGNTKCVACFVDPKMTGTTAKVELIKI